MKTEFQHILTSSILLGLFAMVGVAIVAGLQLSTADRIAANREAVRLRSLNAVLPPDRYNNDILNDKTVIRDELLQTGGKPVEVYLARKGNEPVAAVFETVAPKGYNGPIYLLVGINLDGTVSGVRILSHKETPGLGDAIDYKHSDWISGFSGKSLQNPKPERWAVKRDGGDFDQFTGATISPRAVVKSVRESLAYFMLHKTELFPSLQEK